MAARAELARVDRVEVAAFRVPTDQPEGDGTLRWDSTTLVLARVHSRDLTGLGYTYASRACATLIDEKLASVVVGRDVADVPGAHEAMQRALRNVGIPGAGMMALSAVDIALWDLKARALDLSMPALLGRARERLPIYGSGGFTTYDVPTLQRQLRGWGESGMTAVKMKVGQTPSEDLARVRAAREAVGPTVQLMVDANGAYASQQALAFAEGFARMGVTWFEEPLSSEDLVGLSRLRARFPAGVRLAAGEYGDTAGYFVRMLEAGAVDVLQADITRCGGITGFLRASSLAHAFGVPFSAHCAPALHASAGCAAETLESVEYFHDHVRLEAMLFDGLPKRFESWLEPDGSRPGLGLTLKEADAEKFRI